MKSLFLPTPRIGPLSEFLADCKPGYSSREHLLSVASTNRGYHTKILQGSKVHATRFSAYYALGLLMDDAQASWQRASQIFERLAKMQDRRAKSPTLGIWPYFLEEPLEKMDPPDPNWADFIGGVFATALALHPNRLPADTRELMQAALLLAVGAIRNRACPLHYTNIAVMGSAVAAVANETSGDRKALEFARTRLKDLLALTEQQGGFVEYTSPTYTFIALEELERILLLCRDDECLERATALHELAWRMIAQHFHVPTGQLCGPHSRAYSDYLPLVAALRLSRRTHTAIAYAPGASRDYIFAFQDYLKQVPSCPAKWREAFIKSGSGQSVRSLIKPPDSSPPQIETVYLDNDFCLGSVSRESLWNQRRPLLAYWKCKNGTACFRPRFLKDGKDFASAWIHTVQEKNLVLCTFGFLREAGDFHLFLDAPSNGKFHFSDLRIRFQLDALNIQANQTDQQRWLLTTDTIATAVQSITNPLVEESAAGSEITTTNSGLVLDFIIDNHSGLLDIGQKPSIPVAFGIMFVNPKKQPDLVFPKLTFEQHKGYQKLKYKEGPEIELSCQPEPIPRFDAFARLP